MRSITVRRMAVTAAALAFLGTLASCQEAHADTPAVVEIAIPNNVVVFADRYELIVIGRPTAISPVSCAPGIAWVQAAVLVDVTGGSRAQPTGILVFHEHELPLGSRFLIANKGTTCDTSLRLYLAFLWDGPE